MAANPCDTPCELLSFYLCAGLGGGAPGRHTRIGVPGGPGRWCRRDLVRRSPLQLGPARRLFIRGPGPGPGPYWSIGQSVPLRAAPGTAALCPRRAPQWPRPHGGREPAPPLGSTFSFSFSSREVIPCVSHPFSLSSFSGHPGQSEPVMTARVAGGRRRRRRRWRRKSGR